MKPEKQYLKISLYPWMPKVIEELQEQGFLTTQEHIDDAFQTIVFDTLKKWQQLAEMRKELPSKYGHGETWEAQKQESLSNIPYHVQYVKENLQRGCDIYETCVDSHLQVIECRKHTYMTYQEWIDYNMKHWVDWEYNGKKGIIYGYTEQQVKAWYPEDRFNYEKAKPCTCKMCKDGAQYLMG